MLKAGQRLKEERLAKGITLEEASKVTKIRSSFLSHIEESEYSKLPSVAYAQGFVRNYTNFLGLPEKEILALFRREFDENKVFRVLPSGMARREEFPLKRFKIRNTLAFGALIFLILLTYIVLQYRSAFLGPSLTVSSPKNNTVFASSDVIVSGVTSQDATVFVNDQPVSVLDDGSFKKDINVFPGSNQITVRAINRFGRETVIVREVEAK